MELSQWNYPSAISVGPGAVVQCAELCSAMGMSKPLLVTDPGLAALPMVGELLEALRDAGKGACLFSEIQANPSGANVADGCARFRAHSCDGVIAMGGGSALDAGKAIAFMANQRGELWDYEDSGDNWRGADADAIAPVLAIPTTAGTGSEVGRVAVINREEEQRKVLIFHPLMQPQRVILDPWLTTGLPPHLTAATGMDALSHCLEAYCSPYYHPLADGIALEGMRLVAQFLPRVCADGDDLEARQGMLVASTMGATAFQKGLGAMHALAHPLGAVFGVHHGLLNAILMPYVLVANGAAIGERMQRLARLLDLPQEPQSVLDWILNLRQSIGIPHTLADTAVDPAGLDNIAAAAVEDPSAASNPLPLQQSDYLRILEAAMRGQL